jgi:hypothetical protein
MYFRSFMVKSLCLAVVRELQHAGAPAEIVQWILEPPDRIRIVEVHETADPALNELGVGEREAIVLTGTLGVLDAAAEEGLLDLPTAIGKLRKTSFFASPVLFKRLLDRDAARRSRSKPQH